MKSAINIIITLSFFSVVTDAAVLTGESTLVEGVSAPNQLIVAGEPAKSLYIKLNAIPRKDRNYIEGVLTKSTNQMSCNVTVDSDDYTCSILVSSSGIVK